MFNRHKILLINPSNQRWGISSLWDFDLLRRSFGVYRSIPPWAPTIAALTPEEIEVRIVDENIERINFEEKVDLVGIGAVTASIQRAYEIADEFRKRGIKVAIGGIHASMLPEEASRHADSVIIGEAEDVWKELMGDMVNGRLKYFYRAEAHPCLDDSPIPRFDLLKNEKYFDALIQTTRGCPFDCEFCSVKAFLGPKFRCKKIEQIAKELESCPREFEIEAFGRKIRLPKSLLITDDNIIGNISHTKKLLEVLKSQKIREWWCQASINVGKDKELLSLMRDAGCGSIFIGVESLETEGLNEMGKKINKIEEYEECIAAVQSSGISVVGSFILGSDCEDEKSFEKTVEFINKNNIVFAMINILTPLPGTRLTKKLESEGRILHRDWKRYDAGHVCFKPKKMPPEVLEEGYRWVYQEIYSFDSTLKRLKGFWRQRGVKTGVWEERFKNMPLIEKICFIIIALKSTRLTDLNPSRFRFNLSCLEDILQGKGNLDEMAYSLVINDFAFNLPKAKMDFKVSGSA